MQFRETGHWVALYGESIPLPLLTLFVLQIVARSKNTTWASHLYYNSGRKVSLNFTVKLPPLFLDTCEHHSFCRSLLSTFRRSQRQTDWTWNTPDSVFARDNRYLLADHKSFSSGMPWNMHTVTEVKMLFVGISAHAELHIHSPFFENLHTQLRHFCMHASGDFFPCRWVHLWLNYNSFLHSILTV